MITKICGEAMRPIVLALCGLALPVFLVGQSPTEPPFNPQIPQAWKDAEVETYELPLSYGKPAQYMSAAEYYTIPARTIYRSYPIYRPDREPADYLKSHMYFHVARAEQRRNLIAYLKASGNQDSENIIL